MADIYVLPEVVDEPMNGCAERGLRRDFEQPSNEDVLGEVWGSHVAGFAGSAGENGTRHL